MGVGDYAPADSGGSGDSLLSALFAGASYNCGFGSLPGGPTVKAVGGPWLLQPSS